MSLVSFHDLVGLLHTYGYTALGVIVCLESFGLPLPGESLLIAAAVFASTSHELNIELVVTAAACGAVAGQAGGYGLGRFVGYRLLRRYGGRIGLTSRRLALGRIIFRRQGVKVIVLSRFVAFLRTIAALVAGANRMPWQAFMLANLIGSVVWAALYGFGAYMLGHEAKRVAGSVAIYLGVAAVAAIAAAWLFIRYQERRLLARPIRRFGDAEPKTPIPSK